MVLDGLRKIRSALEFLYIYLWLPTIFFATYNYCSDYSETGITMQGFFMVVAPANWILVKHSVPHGAF